VPLDFPPFQANGRRSQATPYGEATLKLDVDAEVSSGFDHASVRTVVHHATKFAVVGKAGE
jgi:hypothetical protein